MDKRALESLIRDTIRWRTGVEADDREKNLMASDYGIIGADFLYVIADLERELGRPVAPLLGAMDYTRFTVSGLAQAILEG